MLHNKPVCRKNDLVIQEHDGEVLIYDLLDNRALCLNETSAAVWRLCDGNNSVNDIAREIGDEDVVWLALSELKKQKLIEHQPAMPSRFEGMSRREVVRKIGLGSMVAIPVIAALVAPQPAHAASCGSACNTPADCPNQTCNRCNGTPRICQP